MATAKIDGKISPLSLSIKFNSTIPWPPYDQPNRWDNHSTPVPGQRQFRTEIMSLKFRQRAEFCPISRDLNLGSSRMRRKETISRRFIQFQFPPSRWIIKLLLYWKSVLQIIKESFCYLSYNIWKWSQTDDCFITKGSRAFVHLLTWAIVLLLSGSKAKAHLVSLSFFFISQVIQHRLI